MAQFPPQTRVRTTPGSQRVAEFGEKNGLKPVAWYVPTALHAALVAVTVKRSSNLQLMLAAACQDRFLHRTPPDIPPLTPPTRLKQDPHVNVTWYCPLPLYTAMKQAGLDIGASMQQLITSSMVAAYGHEPEVKDLRIITGVAPYLRAPLTGDINFQHPPRKPR